MRRKLHFIPGTMCTKKLWGRVEPHLKDTFELVYLDIPRNKNFDETANYYNKIIAEDKVNLVGFSLGGYLATWFSTRYPERINKLFVISNTPTSLPPEELNQRKAILKYVEENGYAGMSRKKVVSLLDTNSQSDDLIDLILEMDNELGESAFMSQYQYTSERIDLAQAIGEFPFHTGFYCSQEDKLIDIRWLNRLSEASAKLSFISTPGSGHMLPLEKPLELAQHLRFWAVS